MEFALKRLNSALSFHLESEAGAGGGWRFGQVITVLVTPRSNPVSTEMGDHSWVYHLGILPATEANSAFYPQRDGKCVPATRR